MAAPTRPGTPSYSFDNDDPASVDRHRYLSAMLDDFTFSRLSTVARQQLAGHGPGGDLTGRRCLEVGAGGGSVARWLADRVGPTGRVVATDLNPRHIPPYPGYTVVRNDLTVDPVPDGPWDVIHVRMVLMHLPERREILGRLAAALAPGGTLLVEDWATLFGSLVLSAPDAETAALLDAYQEALVSRILPARGNDPTWAVHAHGAMLAEGLVNVETVIDSRSWPGGSPGTLIVAANVAQLRAEFLAAGFTPDQLDRLRRAVHDPRLVLRGHFTYSTAGRRPLA